MTDLHPVREAGEVLGKQQPRDQIHQYYDSEPGAAIKGQDICCHDLGHTKLIRKHEIAVFVRAEVSLLR